MLYYKAFRKQIMIKNIIKKILGVFGKELRGLDSPTRSFKSGLIKVKENIENPRTIIDIGAASGTEDLYNVFKMKDYSYMLVEANPKWKESLKVFSEAIIENVFCGEKDLEVEISDDGNKSSRYGNSGNKIKVPVKKLDDLIYKNNLEAPFFIKIDVEGSEIDVLKGATETLKKTEAIIAEAWVVPRIKGTPKISDLVSFMLQHDFVIFDIVAGANDNKRYLRQVDLIFVKSTSKIFK